MKKWYVLRDLTRSNAKLPAYKRLGAMASPELVVYTPMKERVTMVEGKARKEEVPCIHDLLFVYAEREDLDPVVAAIGTLQYRFVRGGGAGRAMTVREEEMNRFMSAIGRAAAYRLYAPDEVPASLFGKRIRMVGGVLDGLEGRLMSRRGSKVKRLIIELEGLVAAGIEVEGQYIQEIRP